MQVASVDELVADLYHNLEDAALTACELNLRNLGTMVEMWAVDHNGRYPAALSEMKPKYFSAVPTCPAAGGDSYSRGYSVFINPNAFVIFCAGHHHPQLQANFPRYDSKNGLQRD